MLYHGASPENRKVMKMAATKRLLTAGTFIRLCFLVGMISAGVAGNTACGDAESCPPWFIPREGENNSQICECGQSLDGLIVCQDNSSCQLSIPICYCMTYDEETEQAVVGSCLYGCFQRPVSGIPMPSLYHHLPLDVSELNSYMCGLFHRQGQLCSWCLPGYIQPLYTYTLHCVQCEYTAYEWLKYAVLAFVPVTIFFFVIICCRIRITSGSMNAFVQVCQILSAPIAMRIYMGAIDSSYLNKTYAGLLRTLCTLYGIWNLDFFRTLLPPGSVCIDATSLEGFLLEYATTLYPFVLLAVSYILIELHAHNFKVIVWVWRPFHKCFARLRRQWNVQTSIIDAFATFIILSYIKLLNASLDLLLGTKVYSDYGAKSKLYLYYNGYVEYFGKEHLPCAIAAIAVIVMFILFPPTFLLLYSCKCCNGCLSKCSLWQFHAFRTFADAFQGCYKDGSNETRDCRYFAVFYLLLRIALSIAYGLAKNSAAFPLQIIILVAFTMLLLIIRPYKVAMYNIIDAILVLTLAMVLLSAGWKPLITQQHIRSFMLFLQFFFGIIPLVYGIGLFSYWVISHKRIPQRVVEVFRKLRKRYHNPQLRHEVNLSLPDRLVNPAIYVALDTV